MIHHLKSIFVRHGIPEVFQSDGGVCYTAHEFKKFATEYGFRHTISSPEFPQSNGAAERAVRTVKEIWRKSLAAKEDPYLAMLAYRTTPLQNGYSPAELLMSRLRSTVPQLPENLKPALENPET